MLTKTKHKQWEIRGKDLHWENDDCFQANVGQRFRSGHCAIHFVSIESTNNSTLAIEQFFSPTVTLHFLQGTFDCNQINKMIIVHSLSWCLTKIDRDTDSWVSSQQWRDIWLIWERCLLFSKETLASARTLPTFDMYLLSIACSFISNPLEKVQLLEQLHWRVSSSSSTVHMLIDQMSNKHLVKVVDN